MTLGKIVLVFGAMSVLAACSATPPISAYAGPAPAQARIDSNLG